jgi:hypothetical protein
MIPSPQIVAPPIKPMEKKGADNCDEKTTFLGLTIFFLIHWKNPDYA